MRIRVLSVVGIVVILGCGSSGRTHAPVHAVEGRVLVSGMPAANAQIAFHPQNSDANSPRPTGRSGPDGRFHLTTYAPNDGAPAGEYVVTLIWPNDSIPVDECVDPVTHDRLNGYYADPAKQRIRVTVRPGENPITLDVSVGNTGWSLPRKRVDTTK